MPDDRDSSAEIAALKAENDRLRRGLDAMTASRDEYRQHAAALGEVVRKHSALEARVAARDAEVARWRARLEGRDPKLLMH
jgi:predicted RNase H-like nuclease (RuvC/YqgF family)